MSKYYETTWVHLYLLRALQWYEEPGGGHCGLGDLNLTKKTNKQPSLIDRWVVGWAIVEHA
jgi:hypothetical protein